MTTRPISNVVTTWTNVGTSYTGLGVNVYSTAYATDSRPFNIRVNGNSIFSVDPLGTMRGNSVNIIFSTANSAYNFSNSLSTNANTVGIAFNTANAAYNFANNLAVSSGDPSFAFRHANSAFDKANTVTGQVIASGTRMTFQQTTAPTGFTKVTTYNDYAMRIVSGSVANKTNGVAFTTAFSSQTPSGTVTTSVSGSVGATTLTTSQIPGHVHDVTISSFAGDLGFVATNGGGDGGWYDFQDAFCDDGYHYNPTGSGVSAAYARSTGGGGSHTHSFSGSASSTFSGSAINMAVNYLDFILATAD